VITKNPMQLKAFIKKKAEENNISSQLVMQNYMMERLLERISLSPYRKNFILKGGFLIAAIVGLNSRTTMDLDATIKGLDLTHESIDRIFKEICAIKIEDNITFSVLRTTEIREGDDYPGLRVALEANYHPLAVPLTVDVTTGDKITPREVKRSLQLLFDDRSISVFTYNLETVLAEKIETVLSRNIANTRPRDFYDIYILTALYGQ
jgi:predicted nucleotidyltransferase component of viral defense system